MQHSANARMIKKSEYLPQIIKLLSIVCLTFAAICFLATPENEAWGRGVRTDTNVNQYDWDTYLELHQLQPIKLSDIERTDFSFTDDASGAILTHYSKGLPAFGKEFEAPYIETLDVQRGEDCLHYEGTCEACDKLRTMYRDGEINALYRTTIVPGVETEEDYCLSVPLDEKLESYAVYSCDDGSLKESYSPSNEGSDVDYGFENVTLRGNQHKLQSPFGIAYNKSDPQRETANRVSVQADVPDDDPPDEEPSLLDRILSFVIPIAGFAALVAVFTFGGTLWQEFKHRMFVNRFK